MKQINVAWKSGAQEFSKIFHWKFTIKYAKEIRTIKTKSYVITTQPILEWIIHGNEKHAKKD